MRSKYLLGLKIGMPICLGYLAVAFSIGLYASKAGFNAFEAMFVSLLLNASAGEYAVFSTVSAGGSVFAVAAAVLVANIRYLLMSFALTQKMEEPFTVPKRMLIGIAVTDELFGAAISLDEKVTFPFYIGMMSVAVPGWALGTFLGGFVGNLLPAFLVQSLSVGLYGMFIAIVIPEGKKNRSVLLAIIAAAVLSYILSLINHIVNIDNGITTVIVTLVVSSAFALLFPKKEKETAANE